MEIAFTGLDLEGVELLPGERLLDLEYADDIALICDSSQTCQAALDRLALAVSRFGFCFAPSKCKAFLQYWQGSPPALTLGGNQQKSFGNSTIWEVVSAPLGSKTRSRT
ncbi:unnamed protein product, partial [Dicrocoelium dendriticum]